jgi:hypothetical protein
MTMKKHMTIVLLLAALTLGPPLIMPASGQSVGQVHKKAAHATNKVLKKRTPKGALTVSANTVMSDTGGNFYKQSLNKTLSQMRSWHR